MKNRVIFITVLLCVAMAVIASSLHAQNKRIGTSAAPELLIPVGARDLAMGGSGIATSEGVEAIYWNPAGLGTMSTAAQGMFSSMRYIADIQVVYGAAAASFGGFGVVGLSIKSLNFGDIPYTTEDDPEGRGGRTFSPTYVTVGLSYSRQLTDVISVGGTVKVISEQIDRVSSTGVAFDFGVQYHRLIGIPGFHIGVAAKHIGPQMKFDGTGLYRTATSSDGRRPEQKYKSEAASFDLPSLLEIGLGYTARVTEKVAYAVNGSFTNNNLGLDEFRLGGEISYALESLRLFGRIGYPFTPKAESKDQRIFSKFPSLGVGLTYTVSGIDITLDYAYRAAEYFDANQIIAVKLGF